MDFEELIIRLLDELDDPTQPEIELKLKHIPEKEFSSILDTATDKQVAEWFGKLGRLSNKRAGLILVEAFQKMNDKRIIEPLVQSLEGRSSTVYRLKVIDVLRRYSRQNRDEIIQALIKLEEDDKTKTVKNEARAALKDYNPTLVNINRNEVEKQRLKSGQKKKRKPLTVESIPTQLLDNEYKEAIRELFPVSAHGVFRRDEAREIMLIKVGKPVIPSMIASLGYYSYVHKTARALINEHPEVEQFKDNLAASKIAIDSSVFVLQEITGLDYGDNAFSWMNWWQDQEDSK